MSQTIHDIKRAVEASGDEHFFSRQTLRFFGQTLRDFRVRHIKGRVFIYAPGGFGNGPRLGVTFRELVNGCKLVTPSDFPNKATGYADQMAAVCAYLEGVAA